MENKESWILEFRKKNQKKLISQSKNSDNKNKGKILLKRVVVGNTRKISPIFVFLVLILVLFVDPFPVSC